jgi:hypothetical protein
MCALLDGHPQLAAFPEETNYMRTVLPRLGHLPVESRFDYLTQVSNARFLFSESPKIEYHLDKNARLENYKGFPHAEYLAAFEAAVAKTENRDRHLLVIMIEVLLAILGRSTETISRWVEKTPDNSYCMERIRKCFPEAKIIVMLRDPRGKFAGHLERKRKGGQNFSAINPIRNWLQTSALIREQKAISGSMHVVKFEQLLTDPEPVMRGVCDYLEIDFDPVLLNPTKTGELWRGNSAVVNKFQGINPEPARRWEKILNKKELAWVELHCKRDMELNGYKLLTNGTFFFPWWILPFAEERFCAYIKARSLSLRELVTHRYSRSAENRP